MNGKTKKLTAIAMLCAFAYIVMVICRIPIVLFLKYEPKDVIITIGGFIFGPLSACLMSVVVSFVEMITVSDTGFIGFVMNFLASCAFACTAAYIYKIKHTIAGAVVGLAAGCFCLTVIMILWNYFVTPAYMGIPRQDVVALLVPAILPFNLLKGVLNAAITLLLYKPVITALCKANLVAVSSKPAMGTQKRTGFLLITLFVLSTAIMYALILKGII